METVGWKIEGLRPIMVMYVKFSLLNLITDCTFDANWLCMLIVDRDIYCSECHENLDFI